LATWRKAWAFFGGGQGEIERGRPSRSCWGFPLGCEVFAGNRNDVTTLEELIERMEAKYGRAKRIWVFDRGIVSESDLEFLRERGGRYLAGTPKKKLRNFEKDLVEADWREVRWCSDLSAA
jgi:hypothetical protein